MCHECYNKGPQLVQAKQETQRTPQLQLVVRSHSAPALTPEKQTQLRAHMKAEPIGQQGKSLSVGEKSRVLLALVQQLQPTSPMQQLQWSFDRSVKRLAQSGHRRVAGESSYAAPVAG